MIPVEHNFTLFPFDVYRVSMLFTPKNPYTYTLFVPDFASYINHDAMPIGLGRSLQTPGFTIHDSLFSFDSYRTESYITTNSYTSHIDQMRLRYDLLLLRELTNPFVVYFIPLMVILLILFIVFVLAVRSIQESDKRSLGRYMGTYAGIFFSTIILHQTLRNQYPTGELLYLEYFFFYVYVTTALFMIHALLSVNVPQIRTSLNHISQIGIRLFWPVHIFLWIMTTFIIFY